MTRAGERLFRDTNVLLSAVDRRRGLHAQALHVLSVLPDRRVVLFRRFDGVDLEDLAELPADAAGSGPDGTH